MKKTFTPAEIRVRAAAMRSGDPERDITYQMLIAYAESIERQRGPLLRPVSQVEHLDTSHRSDLEKLPLVRNARPPALGYCMGSEFFQYVGTNCFQWYVNRSAGSWTPYGPVFAIDETQL